MALFIFTCHNPRCGCSHRVPLAEIPEEFWQWGYRNPSFFDQRICAACGAGRPQVQILPGGKTSTLVLVT